MVVVVGFNVIIGGDTAPRQQATRISGSNIMHVSCSTREHLRQWPGGFSVNDGQCLCQVTGLLIHPFIVASVARSMLFLSRFAVADGRRGKYELLLRVTLTLRE